MSKDIIIGVLVLALLIGGGVYLAKRNTNDANQPTPTTKTESPAPKTSVTPSVVKVPGVPNVETGTSSFVSSSTAVVNGQVRPNGASTSYWFEYGETTSLGNRTVSSDIGSGYSNISTPAYITGLRATTVYYFRLSARNSFGTVNGSVYTFQTNNTPPVPGVAPTVRTNSATSLSRETADLNGHVNPNGWETNYWFEYGKTTGLGNVTSITSAGASTATFAVSASLSGLEPLTKYYFRLNAQNQYGTVNGTTLSFTTSGPASPSSPSVSTDSASNITASSARLNGRINPNGAQTDYWFEYSQDSLLGSLIGSGTPVKTLGAGDSEVSVQDTLSGLARDTRYFYRLVGRNAYGTVLGDIESFRTKE